MSTLGFSIIIPCYNAGKFLDEAVKSILSQSFRYPFEVIVVDDGSTDNETKIALGEIAIQKKIRIIKLPKNKGLPHARNEALSASSFKYVFTVDADDCLNTKTDVLKSGTYPDRAIDILETTPEVAFVHTMTLMFGDHNGLTISAYPVTESMILKKHHAPNSIVYRKEDAIGAGLRDENIIKWTDWSFAVGILNYRFLSGKKNKIEFLKEPYYLYRIHTQTQRVSAKVVSELDMIQKTFSLYPEIFRKYYPNVSDKFIPEMVLANKPDRLKDLLHIAANDLNAALEMTRARKFRLTSEANHNSIP